MSDYEGYIEELIVKISPGQKEISQASKSHNFVRDFLNKKSVDGEFFPIDTTFLTGSYSRQTKLSPIDDVDMFIVLNGSYAKMQFLSDTRIIPNGPSSLYNNYVDNRGFVSSIQVLNLFRSVLNARYPQQTQIRRDGQVVNIMLSTYGLSLDVVPAFYKKNILDKDYFLIPAGGNRPEWIKTNPKLDNDLLTKLQSVTGNRIRGIIKLVKLWNKNCNNSALRNYHVESIATNIFKKHLMMPLLLIAPVKSYHDSLKIFFNQAQAYIHNCSDPTEVSDAITSNLDSSDKVTVMAEIEKAKFLINRDIYAFLKYLIKE